MRCAYCHNPDTWKPEAGSEVSPREVLERALRYRDFWGAKGGITASGGEPLLQLDFVADLFELAKREGAGTCLDTSGYPYNTDPAWLGRLERLLAATDLVLLDIKHINPERHRRLTGKSLEPVTAFARHLSLINKPAWIRHVLAPGWTDDEQSLLELSRFIHTLGNVERVEVLPFHNMARHKWESLGIPYRMRDAEPPSGEMTERARAILGAVTDSRK